jgi:MFS family permease
MLSSLAKQPFTMVLTFGVITGIGFGFSNASTMPPVLKWFPESKGLVTGILLGGIAFASVLYSLLMVYLLGKFSLSASFLIIGIAVFILKLLLAQLLENPQQGYTVTSAVPTELQPAGGETPNYTMQEMLKTSSFYIIWAIFALSSATGLMIIGHATKIAKAQTGWDGGFLLVILIAVFNCLGRIAGGYLSDKVGRIRYIRWAFFVQAINMLAFRFYGSTLLLGLGAAIAGICYGSVIATIPVVTVDYFGLEHFGACYSLVFTAWGFSGIIGPMMAAAIFDATSSYNIAYLVCGALLIAACLISFKLKRPSQVDTFKKTDMEIKI